MSALGLEVGKDSPLHIYMYSQLGERQLFVSDQKDKLNVEDVSSLFVVTRHSSDKLEFSPHTGLGRARERS